MEGIYNNDLNNLGSDNSQNTNGSRNKKIFTFVLIGLFVVLIFVLLYVFFTKEKESIIETPTYAPAGGLGAKEMLVPEDFPLPERVSFEQEFERSLGGYVSYVAIWNEADSSFEETKTLYENYMQEGGWEPIFVSFGDGYSQLTGSKNGMTLNIGFRQSDVLEVQINFSEEPKN